MQKLSESPDASPFASSGVRFFLPVVVENVVTITITFFFSAIVGNISVSSLAAVTLVNTVITFLMAALSLLTMGSSILTSRFVGARDREKTTNLVEQSVFLTVVITVSIALLLLVLSYPVSRLMLPNAEALLFQEARTYLCMMALSLPFIMFYNVACVILRAINNSKTPMLLSFVMNVTQVLLAYLFVTDAIWPGMGVIGAGLATLISRILAGAASALALHREKTYFSLSIRRICIPDRKMIHRIFHIGIPTTLEQICVQGGYLVANAMAVSLGTHDAAVYTVTSTLYSIPIILHSIFYAVTVPYVGHYIGAGDIPSARKVGFRFAFAGMICISLLSMIIILMGRILVPMLSADGDVIRDAEKILWVILLPALFGMPLNTLDPALRTGGDVKCVMIYTGLAVWLVRLPLTWLFCFEWHMGVLGVFYANAANLLVRAISAFVRFSGKKWAHPQV